MIEDEILIFFFFTELGSQPKLMILKSCKDINQSFEINVCHFGIKIFRKELTNKKKNTRKEKKKSQKKLNYGNNKCPAITRFPRTPVCYRLLLNTQSPTRDLYCYDVERTLVSIPGREKHIIWHDYFFNSASMIKYSVTMTCNVVLTKPSIASKQFRFINHT